MCLAVPGRLLDVEEADAGREGRVAFGSLVRRVRLDFVPGARPGDFVLVHVGFAIGTVDADEAARAWQALAALDALAGELGGDA